jgi:hypothetical protein
MHEQYAVIVEELGAFAEVGIIEPDTDMLEHAHRDDAVKRAPDIAVVLQMKLDAIAETFFRNTASRHRKLFFRERDSRAPQISLR